MTDDPNRDFNRDRDRDSDHDRDADGWPPVEESPAGTGTLTVPAEPAPRPRAVPPRLAELSLAIELFPQAAVNYLLRGEYFLEDRQFILAQADFETALTLAQAQLATDAWGIVNQMVIDRASRGLQHLR
ncbi:MAG: hypothetical protein MUE40_06325 [Anaerolineae bacterium]|jgi:hypothetical protein|nr:hypothetical protein [Anaerolineae bacterium]